MARPGPFVKSIERIADSTGVLVPAELAILFDDNFAVTDAPAAVLSGSAGGAGEVTGYTRIALSPKGGGGALADTTTQVATIAAALAQLGSAEVLGTVQFTNIGDDPGFYEVISRARCDAFGNDSFLEFIGRRTTVSTQVTTLSVVAAFGTGTKPQYQLTYADTTHPNLTALGWADGGAWVSVSTTPEQIISIGKDLGSGIFEGSCATNGGVAFTSVSLNPTPGTCVVYKIPKIGGLFVDSLYCGGVVHFKDLEIGSIEMCGQNPRFTNCRLSTNGPLAQVNRDVDNAIFNNCVFGAGLTFDVFGAAFLYGGIILNSGINFTAHNISMIDGWTLSYGSVIVGGSVINEVVGNSYGRGQLAIGGSGRLACSDWVGWNYAIDIRTGSYMHTRGFVFLAAASAEAAGIHIGNRALLSFAAGHIPVANLGTDPTIDWQVGSTTKTQAAMGTTGFVDATTGAAVEVDA
jgi:hypothetical protein